MDPRTWKRIQELFFAALERSEDEREEFVKQASAGDRGLSDAVSRLLREHEAEPAFLETPVVDFDTRMETGSTADRLIGQYRVVRLLGRGGMGEVFLAVREGDDYRRSAAVKLIRQGLDTVDVLARFRQERRILAALHHPNIAQLLDGGATDEGRPYFVMEYIEGEPIDRYADRNGLTIAQRLELFRTICEAVQHAHSNLVVHRDLKPGNILVTADGVPKLLDFGIGKVLETEESIETRTGSQLLTPEYAAPEQVRGETVTTATDIYGLGVLLYELLTGHRPYDLGKGTPLEIERAVCETEPAAPSTIVRREATRTRADGTTERVTPTDISARRATDPHRLRRRLAGDLDNIVLMAVRKQPGRRYPSAAMLGEDVRRHLAGLPVAARPDTLRYRAVKFARRNAAAVVAVAAIMVALAATSIVTQVQSRRVARERDQAVEERAKAIEVRGFLLEMFGGAAADQAAADTITARQLLDLQGETVDETYADRPALRAEMLQVLAEGYERLGMLSTAEGHAGHALRLRRELYGAGHADIAASLNQLGWITHALGRSREALPLLEEAVSIRRGLGDPQRVELSRSLNDLGSVLDHLGAMERAEPLLSEALAIRLELLGPGHRAVGITANNLAVLYFRQGDFAEAARLGQQALEALRVSVGPDHQRSVIAQNNLALFQRREGAFAEAERTLRNLLVRQTRIQGQDHPVTALVMSSLASVLVELGQIDEAEGLYRDALAILEEKLGSNHRDVASSWSGIGSTLYRGGRYIEAVSAHRQALAIRRTVLGDDHSAVGSSLLDLARTHQAMGKLDQAERHYRESLAVTVVALGDDHPQVAAIRLSFGGFLVDRNPEEARVVLSAALAGASARNRTSLAHNARLALIGAHLALGDRAAANGLARELVAARDAGELTPAQLEHLRRLEARLAEPS